MEVSKFDMNLFGRMCGYMDKRSEFHTIDEYIRQYDPEMQKILTDLRNAVRDAAPEAREKISYRMPAFEYFGNLVYFAVFRNHIGFYPTPSGTDAFSRELSEYKTSKGAIQFPLGKPLPLDLIRRIVKFRAEENFRKAADQKSGKRH